MNKNIDLNRNRLELYYYGLRKNNELRCKSNMKKIHR